MAAPARQKSGPRAAVTGSDLNPRPAGTLSARSCRSLPACSPQAALPESEPAHGGFLSSPSQAPEAPPHLLQRLPVLGKGLRGPRGPQRRRGAASRFPAGFSRFAAPEPGVLLLLLLLPSELRGRPRLGRGVVRGARGARPLGLPHPRTAQGLRHTDPRPSPRGPGCGTSPPSAGGQDSRGTRASAPGERIRKRPAFSRHVRPGPRKCRSRGAGGKPRPRLAFRTEPAGGVLSRAGGARGRRPSRGVGSRGVGLGRGKPGAHEGRGGEETPAPEGNWGRGRCGAAAGPAGGAGRPAGAGRGSRGAEALRRSRE